MRSLICVLMVFLLAGCAGPIVSDAQKEQIKALPQEQQIDQILLTLEKIPGDNSSKAVRRAIESLLEMSVALQKSGVEATDSQLNRLNQQAEELDWYYQDLSSERYSDFFIAKGADPSVRQARVAAAKGDIKRLKMYYSKGLTRSYKDVYSPLAMAARYNQFGVIAYLLTEEGLDPDADAVYGNNQLYVPLYAAGKYAANPDIVDTLMITGSRARPDTALYYALRNPRGGLISERLAGYGARPEPDALNHALFLAFQDGHMAGTEALMKLGANPTVVSAQICGEVPRIPAQVEFMHRWCQSPVESYYPAMINAIDHGDRDMAEALLLAGFEVNREEYLYTQYPLEHTIYRNQPEIARLLLFSGANPNIDLGGTAGYSLDLAEDHDLPEISRLIRQYGGVNKSSFFNFDTVMKTLTTTAIGAGIYASNVDAYHGTEIFSAAVSDVWSGGQSNSLATLSQRYMKGDISVSDPALARLLKQEQAYQHSKAVAHRNMVNERKKYVAELDKKQRSIIEASRNRKAKSDYAVLRKALLDENKQSVQEKKKAKPAQQHDQQKAKPQPVTYRLSVRGNMKTGDNSEYSGEFTHRNLKVGDIAIRSITTRYRISTIMGQPLVSGSWKWESDSDVTLPYNFAVLLRIENGQTRGYIKIDPSIPKSNKGYGFNASGSPNWKSFICGYQGNQKLNCLNKEQAQMMLKGGQITGMVLTHQ
ncbi:ankyrin repeat domain-containing protein [Vibrio mangrovi]|uniref:Ankyrin repeat domain-containing protein n=1 Tax=Vibrio mangrovi TaxID=474394 RepID=A0A1Y6ITW1_9VIBR|nr:ankyrin repeat domain-containing protein [Vibrio mangrovi]MDW6003289.1 ankyrin repeat domain-containing protein [Vibrio mangrovi]SMR99922.1 Ankyrin repeats (3 copies) [Vibrio mangrovi]